MIPGGASVDFPWVVHSLGMVQNFDGTFPLGFMKMGPNCRSKQNNQH